MRSRFQLGQLPADGKHDWPFPSLAEPFRPVSWRLPIPVSSSLRGFALCFACSIGCQLVNEGNDDEFDADSGVNKTAQVNAGETCP